MTPNPLSVREAATTREAALFLSSRGISAAPVIDEAGRPIGVVSRSDLLSHRAHRRLHLLDGVDEGPPTRVREVMTPAVFCVRPETSAGKVVEKMLALRVRRLFVVDDDGVLIGVISTFDLAKALRPHTPCGCQEADAARPERSEGGTKER